MSTLDIPDRLTPMTAQPTPNEARGAEIEARMKADGIKLARLARLAGGISRTTVYAAFRGEASDETMTALEEALDYAAENPGDVPEQAGAVQKVGDQMVEFEVNIDAIGVRVVVRGPIENAAMLEAEAAKLIRDMRSDTGTGS